MRERVTFAGAAGAWSLMSAAALAGGPNMIVAFSAVPAGPASVPTLGEWSLLLLILALGILGFGTLRRRNVSTWLALLLSVGVTGGVLLATKPAFAVIPQNPNAYTLQAPSPNSFPVSSGQTYTLTNGNGSSIQINGITFDTNSYQQTNSQAQGGCNSQTVLSTNASCTVTVQSVANN